MIHSLDDPAKLVPLYAVKAKMRLFASERTVAAADKVIRHVIETYYLPNDSATTRDIVEHKHFDLLTECTAACRDDLLG